MPDANAQFLVITNIVGHDPVATRGMVLASQEQIIKRSDLTIEAINAHKQAVMKTWLAQGQMIAPVIHAIVPLD